MQSIYRITTNYIQVPSFLFGEDIRLSLVSDIHCSKLVTAKDLYNLHYQLKLSNPNYICVVGDSLDNTNILNDKDKKNEMLNFFKNIAEIAPVSLSVGGHDFTNHFEHEKKRTESKAEQIAHASFEWNQEFWNSVREIPQLTLVTDSFIPSEKTVVFETPMIYIAGFTQPFDYYHNEKNMEKIPLMREQLRRFMDNIQPLPKDKPTVLLLHSPVSNEDEAIKGMLTKFDLVMSGHMHGGLVPPVLYELCNSNSGIIAPGKLPNRPDTPGIRLLEKISSTRSLFPSCSRGIQNLRDQRGNQTTVVLSSGIVKIQDCAPSILKPFDYFFPRDIHEVILTEDAEKAKRSSHYQYRLSKNK